MATNQIPRDDGFDNSLALLKEGYLYIHNRAETFQSDLFKTRIMGKNAICMRGKEAAKLFYDEDKFQRKLAVPNRIQETLIGKRAIQTLDGQKHRLRKYLFMSLMTPQQQKQLAEKTAEQWKQAKKQWETKKQIVLFEEAKKVLCKVACEWAGVPLSEREVSVRADDFISIVYVFGRVGPEHWKGRIARNRIEDWLEAVIDDTRSGTLHVDEATALYKMAFFQDKKGQHFSTHMAAVELMNVIRPIVAIATYITFAAVALHEHAGQMEKLKAGTHDDFVRFIHEVRRYYPFGPFVGARVKKTFYWKNVEFKKGTLVFLDIYGTNHDPRIWENPNEFNPDRFQNWDGNLFNFIPHGGGDPAKGHRCPGEGITVEVMRATLDFLVNHIDYHVPSQDLSYKMNQIPTLPKSGFVMSFV